MGNTEEVNMPKKIYNHEEQFKRAYERVIDSNKLSKANKDIIIIFSSALLSIQPQIIKTCLI